MFGIIKRVFLIFKIQPIYSFSLVFLFLVIALTQNQYWFGEHSNHDLFELNESISAIEDEMVELKNNNQILAEERDKLSSGREALEGAARYELGMIKPGEKFYVFKNEVDEQNIEDKN
jgi:cell division protein FtsB